jgi:hypothetical protein
MSPIVLFVDDIKYRLSSETKRTEILENLAIENEKAEIECNEMATKCKRKFKDLIEAGILSPDIVPPGWLER